MPPDPGGRRRRRLVWSALALVVLAIGIVAAVALSDDPGDVSNPDVAFEPTPPEAPVTTTPPATTPRQDAADDAFTWPIYGLTPERTKYLPLRTSLRPPFVERWRVGGSVLLEFPPVSCGRQLFLLKNNGALYAISRRTGKVRWKRLMGHLAASSPACGNGEVYVVLLEREKGARAGRVAAVSASTGAIRWSRPLPSRAESSPLLDGERLYFGSEDGTVYALRTTDGAVRGTAKAGGAVKGALAEHDGILYFGDYSGQVTALRKADGSRVWRSSGVDEGLGRGRGTFYSTPAVAYGRVYIGSTDGFVYSFSARDGALAWRHETGGYVYSSPAVSPILGGTVYAGSYDHRLYAFDARTGKVRWAHDSGGRISGGVQVVGDLVFYADLDERAVEALGAATGQPVWKASSGAFNPLISDGRRLYVVGYTALRMYTEKGVRSDGALTSAERAERSQAARAAELRRRVLERKRYLHNVLRLRRLGRRACFTVGTRRTCRIPRPPVCLRQADGRTVCRGRLGS